MGIDYIGMIANSICLGISASIFFKAAEMEDKSPWLWVTFSLALYLFTFFILHWGWVGGIIGQAGLFVAITLFRTLFDLKSK